MENFAALRWVQLEGGEMYALCEGAAGEGPVLIAWATSVTTADEAIALAVEYGQRRNISIVVTGAWLEPHYV